MKIAVLVSGLVRVGHPQGDLVFYNKRHKEKFPDADFYYGAWKGCQLAFEKHFPNEKCNYFDEPQNHYHPYIDVPREAHISKHFTERVEWAKKLPLHKKEWTGHHAKQVLAHALLCEKIDYKKYDVIIRTRYDAFVHRNANFNPYIKKCFETGETQGFAVTRPNMWHKFYKEPMMHHYRKQTYLIDQLIIHRSDCINPDSIKELFSKKELTAAEFGWYQALVMPYSYGHMMYHGFVNHDKNIITEYLLEDRK